MGSIAIGTIPEHEGWHFTDSAIEQMKDMASRTEDDRAERTCSVCRSGDTLFLTDYVRGGYGVSSTMISECPDESPEGIPPNEDDLFEVDQVGNYHTHPTFSPEGLSRGDKLHGLITMSEVLCVGKGDSISCYEESRGDLKDERVLTARRIYSSTEGD